MTDTATLNMSKKNTNNIGKIKYNRERERGGKRERERERETRASAYTQTYTHTNTHTHTHSSKQKVCINLFRTNRHKQFTFVAYPCSLLTSPCLCLTCLTVVAREARGTGAAVPRSSPGSASSSVLTGVGVAGCVLFCRHQTKSQLIQSML